MSLSDRRKQRRQFQVPKLMITSMMDMFTIILIFLLFSFSENPETIQLEKDLELPYSSAKEDYNDSIHLVLSQGSLILGGEVIATLSQGKVEGLNPNRLKESILYQRLLEHKRSLENQPKESVNDLKKTEEKRNQILFLCDKSHPFKVINPVIKTAGLAGFPNFQFAVLKE